MHAFELRPKHIKPELLQVFLQASLCKALPCRALGSVAWFPVHCTSINNTNQLISGDNKGVASQLMEVWARTNVSDTAAEVGAGLVAAFGQSNVGDTSPNTEGTFCMDTGGLAVSAALQRFYYDRCRAHQPGHLVHQRKWAWCAYSTWAVVHLQLCLLKLNSRHPSD